MAQSSNPNPAVTRFPVLLIGLGGTGVRTLRYALWMAENGQDPGLAAMLESGALQTVAIDTDWKANSPEARVSEYVFPRSSTRQNDSADLLRQLPRLPRLVTVQTEDISRAMEGIRRRRMSAGRNAANDDPLATAALNHGMTGSELEASLSWFPFDDVRSGEEIGIGHARHEGAGQWRPLGRLGLFLEARTIMDELREGHKRVRDATPLDRPVRAIIIGSLSGGTGSGMFWDIAFMLRMIDSHCNVSGSFLLADPFTGSDRAERIEINAYAALKELAGLKNWLQKEVVEVRYPIGAKGALFRREPGDRPVYDTVYVYQSFGPEVTTGNVDDVHKAAVETSCYRIAQNILTQIRTDIRTRIDEGANNERSDANAPAGHPEQAYVFCTSAMVPLDLVDGTYLTGVIEGQFLHGLISRLTGDRMPRLDGQAIGRAMPSQEEPQPLIDAPVTEEEEKASALPAAPRGTSGPGAAPPPSVPMVPNTAQGWLDRVKKLQSDAKTLKLPSEVKTVTRLKEAMTELEEKASSLADPELVRKSELLEARARELYAKYVPPGLRTGWKEDIRLGTWHANNKVAGNKPVGPRAKITVMELLKDDIEAHWKKIEDWIININRRLDKDVSVFDTAAYNQIEDFIRRLDDLKGAPAPDDLVVEAPPSLVHMRAALSLYNEKDPPDQTLKDLYQIHRCGPIDRMMAVFAARLRGILHELGQRSGVRDRFEEAFRCYVSTHLDSIKGKFQALLDQSDANMAIRRERVREIHDYGFRTLRTLFTDGDGHVDEFDKAMKPLPLVLSGLYAAPSDEVRDLVIKGLAERTANIARELGQGQRMAFVGPDDSRETWKTVLDRLRRRLPEWEREAPGPNKLPLTLVVVRVVEGAFCAGIDILPKHEIMDQDMFSDRVLRGRIVLTAFVQFWMEQEDFVLQRMGGEAGLTELMGRCRSRVFGKGAVVSSIQQDKLVIAKPVSATTASAYDARGNRAESLARSIAMGAQNALNQSPSFAGESSRPVIYFEQLFRAGVEILNIERYHQRYMDVPPERRGRYHVIPQAADLPDLMEQGLPTREHRASWACSDPTHDGVLVPHDEAACPRCVDEYVSGFRPWSAVRRNPKETAAECPACVAQSAPAKRRGRIPGALQRFFRDGIRPSEAHQFTSLLEQIGHDVWCPNTDHGRHLLYPLIPQHMPDGEMRLAYLHREGGHFLCSRDGSHYDHNCFHCGFPISLRQLEAIRDGRSVACPRCQRELRECPYCTHRDGALFRPMAAFHGPDRCPRCSNIMHRHTPDIEPLARDGLKNAGFCRNVFGCPSGALPWSTAANYDKHEHCEACRDRRHPALLLPFDELRPIIRRCPVCMTLIGLPENGQLHRYELAALASHLHRHDDPEPDQPCVVCGTQPSAVLYWMLETGYFDGADPAVDAGLLTALRSQVSGTYAVPRIDASNGMDLLEALWRHSDDRILFETLRDLPGIINGRRRFADLERDIRRLFVGKSVAPRVAIARLKALSRIEDDIRARVEGRSIAEVSQ